MSVPEAPKVPLRRALCGWQVPLRSAIVPRLLPLEATVSSSLRAALLLLPLAGCGCGEKAGTTQPADTQPDSGGETSESTVFDDVAVTRTIPLEGLSCDVHVVRTEMGVPHHYAHSRLDLVRVFGYTSARDRYFSMDLARRLGLGKVSEILGQDALEVDMEARQTAMTFVADTLMESLTDEHVVWLEAYADGVNQYIQAVKRGEEPVPSELALAGPFLGVADPTDLMEDFTLRDMAGFMAVLVYELGYETGDVGATADAARIPDFVGEDFEDLRRQSAWEDLYLNIKPLHDVASAPGWGRNGEIAAGSGGLAVAPPRPSVDLPLELLDRADRRGDRLQLLLGRDHNVGWGSNAWAVTGAASADGRALLAGDGHLPLTVPSLFYQVGLDTSVLGGGDTHQMGLTIPGMPFLAVGTNGKVAWSQTQLSGDITDWYAEEIQLSASGVPAAAKFQGEWLPLTSHDESIEIAEVVLLGSEGRTFTFTRYTTEDGRWLFDIEGTELSGELPDSDAIVWMGGRPILPGDTNGDGVVSAISFDYTALDPSNVLLALDKFGHAETVDEVHQAMKHLNAYSQNIVAADSSGSVLYSGYQPVPCRSYLPIVDGWWAEGADPNMLLDGTQYGGFTIPMTADLQADESFASDPTRCLVPFDTYPHAIGPDIDYVQTANNDVAGITFDGDLLNEPYYIGGPWTAGFRGHVIEQSLEQAIAEGWADQDGMVAIQGDQRSVLGALFGPHLVAAIQAARAASEVDFHEPGSPEERLSALYFAHSARFDEVETRLQAWLDGGAEAASGVETFYHAVQEGEAEDAVATMIFNAWLGRAYAAVFDDEGWSPPGGNTGRTRALKLGLEGRGPDNPLDLAGWNPASEELVFFDVLGTAEVEHSEEILLGALVDALDFLEQPGEDGDGGFGTTDMSQWLWGLRHTATFDSLLNDFLPRDSSFSVLTEQFSITTDTLPLADDLESGDPRRELTHFPRPGGNFSVDAANTGYAQTEWRYGSGPTFRMVVSLGENNVSGYNVLPGGQSALTDSEHFADQAALWLGNEVLPLRFHLEDVLAGAESREVYTGAGGACAD